MIPQQQNHKQNSLVHSIKIGSIESFRFLLRTSNFDMKMIKTNDNQVLREICRCGHVEMLRILLECFQNIELNDIRSRNNQCLNLIFERGDLEMLKVLLQKFPELGTVDIHREQLHILRGLCVNGKIKMLEFLLEKYPSLNIESFRSEVNCVLRIVCRRGYVNSVRFILDRFNPIVLDRVDFGFYLDFINNMKYTKGHTEIVQLFSDKFPELRTVKDVEEIVEFSHPEKASIVTGKSIIASPFCLCVCFVCYTIVYLMIALLIFPMV